MISILMPMAGRGARFAAAGYAMPKPLVPLHGIPMIEAVVGNLRPYLPHRFIFVALQDHLDGGGLEGVLRRLEPEAVIVPIAGVTDGAARTALAARRWIDSDFPLVVANCDQWVDADIDRFMGALIRGPEVARIMTMTAHDPRWSFVELDASGAVSRVAEKEVISDMATVGVYGFRRGRDFVAAAERMISRDRRAKGEFYVAPVFNELIAEGKKVAIHPVGRLDEAMFGLGTPEDVERFLQRPQSKILAGQPRVR